MEDSRENPYVSPQAAYPPPDVNEPTVRLQKASRWLRLGGHLIDLAALILIMVPLIVVLNTAFPNANAVEASGGFRNQAEYYTVVETGSGTSAFNFIVLFISLVVANGYLLANQGQTIGKYALGTQILSDDGKLVSLAKLVFLRYGLFWLLGTLPGLGPILGLADALSIYRDNLKCVHDELCGTQVVMFTKNNPVRKI